MIPDRPRVRVAFTDFPGPFAPGQIQSLLERNFDLEITSANPDYVIHSAAGYDFLKYPDCVRIFFTCENVHADFNLCDFAFSFDWLEFGDRHFRAPNFILFDEWPDLCRRGRSTIDAATLATKSRFCNFIYTNPRAHPKRDEFFHALSAAKPVDALGAHLRTMEMSELGSAYRGNWSGQKTEVQKAYKFSIAMENSGTPGYTTEKLVQALSADTIPIYWGDPLVGLTFNEDRFVNLNTLSVTEAVDRVIEIDRDDALFLEIVNRPFFSDGIAPAELAQTALLEKFAAIFSLPRDKAVRRSPYMWGKRYEEQRVLEVAALRAQRMPPLYRRVPGALRARVRRLLS